MPKCAVPIPVSTHCLRPAGNPVIEDERRVIEMMEILRRTVCLLLVLALLMAGCAVWAEQDLAVNGDLDPAWKNILLLGTDKRPGETVARTDTMIILSVNKEEKTVRLTSLMRDMWVDIYGTNRSHKINAANVYGGPEAAMATVNHYFGLNIERYILVDMDGMTEIINQLGGVDIPLTAAEADSINQLILDDKIEDQEDVSEGESVHLTGEQATAYARIRSIGGDQQRTQRQRTVLVAMAETLGEVSLWGMMGVGMTMLDYVETNLSLSDLVDLCRTALDIDLSGIEQIRIPADGAYTMGQEEKSGLSVVWANFEKNTEILHQFIYGE